MQHETWKPVPGYEGRYEVSDQGRVRSVSFAQRYLLRNGKEAFRRTKPRLLATQLQNGGYVIVHMHFNNQGRARTVHRLVALAFLPEQPALLHEINHVNGNKQDNRAVNLEWLVRRDNHLHAVRLGLNKQAVPVTDPSTGVRYPSIAQAAKQARKSHRTVRATFLRAEA